MNDYQHGVDFLNKAVILDKSYGIYWANIGDDLVKSKNFTDAILAFEQGFIALPEKQILLKKIGDCYKASGQIEAAQEAYRIYESKIQWMAWIIW